MLRNRSAPPVTVAPELVYEDVEEAVGWLCEAFGLAVRWQAGGHRAQLWAGDGAVVVRDRPPDIDHGEPVPGGCSSVLVKVADAEAARTRAIEHGARLVRELSDHAYGERQVTFEDLGGHRWTFTQSLADVAPEEWGGTSVDLR